MENESEGSKTGIRKVHQMADTVTQETDGVEFYPIIRSINDTQKMRNQSKT